MVSKRGKRKRSSEGTAQGEQKRKRASGETSVDSTSTGDEIPAEQADTCEEASCADSQETSDLEQNPAVDSTEDKSTLVSSQPSASQPSASQPSGQVDKPSDKSELCEDGGDAPTCTKEVSDTPAPVQDSECHALSTPGKNTEEVPPQKPQSEETDQCDEETNNTLTNEDIECNTSAETVKEEEEPTEEKMGKDENLEESSQKMKESPPQKTEDKSDNSSDQKVDVEQEAPLKDPECLPLPSTDSISASTDVSKTVDKTQDNSIQNIWKEDENKNSRDEGGIGVESTKQSSACRDNQREIITKEETVKEKENVTEMKNVQNGAEDNAVEETYKTDETVVNTATETKNEQNTPKKTVLAEALLLKDDTKPEEKDENLMLKELISKTKLAQPNQAGDFLDTRTLVDKPPIILKSSVEERDKKADREYEPDKFELRKKERLLLEEKHVHLADKEVRVDNVAATDKEFAEPFDLSGSQAFPDDGNAFEMDVTESQLCAVSDDILSEGEDGDDESRRQQQEQQQQDGERLIQTVLNSLLSLNEQIIRTRQQMQAERRKLQDTRPPPTTKGIRQTFHR